MASLIGQSLGRYHILEQLGEGGMAIVYKAYDTRLETDVAIKVIRTDEFSPKVLERALKRFEREAKSLAKLNHPNIVKVIDYGEYQGKPYLVMSLLAGGTLKQKLLGGPMPWQDAVRLLLPIARALDYAHRHGMIHRDVKPSNVLITEDGDTLLTDFGIAKFMDEDVTLDLTGTNALIGTPEYMAPEQITTKVADYRTDIYALGVVLYEMVTGKKPYTADTPLAVLFKHASDPLPRPKHLAPNLPDSVEKVLLKALAKNPDDRYQGMREIVDAFERLIQPAHRFTERRNPMQPDQQLERNKQALEQTPHLTTTSPGTRQEKQLKNNNASESSRKKRLVYWTILGAVLIVVSGVWLNFQNRIESPAPTPTMLSVGKATFTVPSRVAVSTMEQNVSVTPGVTATATTELTRSSMDSSGGHVLYTSKDSSGVAAVFALDLATGQSVKVANNPGYTLNSAAISDNGEFLAFTFGYGHSYGSDLGLVGLHAPEPVEIGNEIWIANAAQFHWLPDGRLIFENMDPQRIEIYDPVTGKTEVLDLNTKYFLSPDRQAIVVIDSETKGIYLGTLTTLKGSLQRVEAVDFSKQDAYWSAEILWSGDSQKFAVLTGNPNRKEKRGISIWAKDGTRDMSFPVKTADWLSFSWGKTSAEYAYVVGESTDNNLANTLFFGSRSIALEQDNPIMVQMLPDGNVALHEWAYASYFLNTDSFTIEQLSGKSFYMQPINNDLLILIPIYSSIYSDYSFVLVDKDGLHPLNFSPPDRWTWDWLFAGEDLWLISKGQILNANKNETIDLNLPGVGAVIGWTP